MFLFFANLTFTEFLTLTGGMTALLFVQTRSDYSSIANKTIIYNNLLSNVIVNFIDTFTIF